MLPLPTAYLIQQDLWSPEDEKISGFPVRYQDRRRILKEVILVVDKRIDNPKRRGHKSYKSYDKHNDHIRKFFDERIKRASTAEIEGGLSEKVKESVHHQEWENPQYNLSDNRTSSKNMKGSSDEITNWPTVRQPWDEQKTWQAPSWSNSTNTNNENSRWDWTQEQWEDHYKNHPNEIEHKDNNGPEKVFKDIKGKTIKEIIALLPEDAEGWDRTNLFKNPPMPAFEFKWIDPRDKGKFEYRRWTVRIHGPDSSPYAGKNARNNWTARVKVGYEQMGIEYGFAEYMDESGTFHHAQVAQSSGINADENIINNTHIVIAAPVKYISPIDHPEHYSRKPQEE